MGTRLGPLVTCERVGVVVWNSLGIKVGGRVSSELGDAVEDGFAVGSWEGTPVVGGDVGWVVGVKLGVCVGDVVGANGRSETMGTKVGVAEVIIVGAPVGVAEGE